MHNRDDQSAEIQAWFDDYQQKLRNEALKEGHNEGVRSVLLRLLHARFGELPAATVAHVATADLADLERWSERVLSAQTLDEVFDHPS